MIKKIITRAANAFGVEIKRKREFSVLRAYDHGEQAIEAIKRVRPYTMLSEERLVTLYQQTLHCELQGIEGAFVECGVWKGGAVALMALVNLAHGRGRRHIHLFDSFQEICAPDEAVDGEKAIDETKQWSDGICDGKLAPLTGFYDSVGGPGTLQGNKFLLEDVIRYDPHYIHYHQGWFQDTIPRDVNDIDSIAILRLDADWYASTKICLKYLFDKVVPGGFVIIDDYGAYEGCKKAVDEFIKDRHLSLYLHHIDDVGRYFNK